MVARSHGGGAGPGGHAAWVLGVGDAVCMVSADFMLLYPSSHPASSREWLACSCSQICQVGRSCHPFLTLKGTKVETGPSLHTVGTWGAGPACSLSTRACSPAQPAQRPPLCPASTAWSRLGPGFSLPEHFPQAPHQLQPDRLAPRLCAAGWRRMKSALMFSFSTLLLRHLQADPEEPCSLVHSPQHLIQWAQGAQSVSLTSRRADLGPPALLHPDSSRSRRYQVRGFVDKTP